MVTAQRERIRRIEGRLRQSPASQPALAAMARDGRLGGPLLAGALAFRLFAVLLPLALLAVAVLGYAASTDDTAPGEIGEAVGIRQATLQSVAQSSKLEADKRWVVLAFAALALVYAAVKAARAVHAAHSLAWTGQVERVGHPLRAGLALLGVIAVLAAVWAVAGRSRADLGAGGLAVALLALLPFFGLWLGVSWLLPHEGAPLSALIPGAVLVAVGLQIVHLGTVLVVSDQMERASATYGPLGAAFTILLWLFVVSRVVVGAAMLNAVLWHRQHADGA
jgi:membrane protein